MLLPLGSASGYCTCSLYESKVFLAHRPQHPSGQTCAMFLLWLCIKGQIDQMSPLVLKTWIDARTIVISINPTKVSLKDLWVCFSDINRHALVTSVVVCKWCHRPAWTGQYLNKTQSTQVRGLTKGAKAVPTQPWRNRKGYTTVISLILFLTNQILLFIVIESTLALFKCREWLLSLCCCDQQNGS